MITFKEYTKKMPDGEWDAITDRSVEMETISIGNNTP